MALMYALFVLAFRHHPLNASVSSPTLGPQTSSFGIYIDFLELGTLLAHETQILFSLYDRASRSAVLKRRGICY